MDSGSTKKIYSYTVFYESDPEGGYVAHVPALSGCHTQGETLEETEINVREAIEAYLDSLVQHGESIPREEKSYNSKVEVPIALPA